MFDVRYYLKKVGFKLSEVSVILKDNYRFPTLSCKLKEGDDGNQIGDNLIFVLSYFISDDFNKQSIEFSFEDWYNWKRGKGEESETCFSVSLFDSVSRNLGFNFFDYFSITESLLTDVFQSRLKGRKAWKKRNWKLPVRWANVYKAFGIEHKKSVNVKATVDNVKIINEIAELDEVMNLCVYKAAKDFSYAPFDVYFDSFKKKRKLQFILNDSQTTTGKVNRDKVFKEFSGFVLALQKG